MLIRFTGKERRIATYRFDKVEQMGSFEMKPYGTRIGKFGYCFNNLMMQQQKLLAPKFVGVKKYLNDQTLTTSTKNYICSEKQANYCLHHKV